MPSNPPLDSEPITLESRLDRLVGFGPATAARFARAGFETVGELLHHVPTGFEDRRHATPVSSVAAAGPATVVGRMFEPRVLRLRGRRVIVRARVEDESGHLDVVWFNQPFMARRLEAGARYRLHGTVRETKSGLQLLNPSCERDEGEPLGDAAGNIVPVYSSVSGIGPAALRRTMRAALASVAWEAVRDPVPAHLRERHGLPEIGVALRRVHGWSEKTATEADRDRLVYGEHLRVQHLLAARRQARSRMTKPWRYRDLEREQADLERGLPFRLTAGQQRVLQEIRADLARSSPMARLLQGEVGSGKTVVAALALAAVAESGFQAVLMAPTELLAEQHLRSLRRLLGTRWPMELVTRRSSGSSDGLDALARGEAGLAVGTHALLEPGVALPRLALVVIDEQQRFGVAQRERLASKGVLPDVLIMTATPIPRSLALAAYGDFDHSRIEDLPPGRAAVATALRPRSQARRVYAELHDTLRPGDLTYVVLPRIDDGPRSVESLVARESALRDWLAPRVVGSLHGRMGAAERDRVTAELIEGRIEVLVATTVIEVGLDVPAASVMVIEGAEQFGLAQLHQLRGRVGRGGRPGRCIALHGKLTTEAKARLDCFAALADGFAIAEADLRLRGPGELVGALQAGMSTPLGDPERELYWLEKAREDAAELL